MSLKGFHIFFITIAALFCAAFGVWALFFDTGNEGGTFAKVLGGITLLSAVALVIYGFHFVRKTKNITV